LQQIDAFFVEKYERFMYISVEINQLPGSCCPSFCCGQLRGNAAAAGFHMLGWSDRPGVGADW
jgi:hypothetical protein